LVAPVLSRLDAVVRPRDLPYFPTRRSSDLRFVAEDTEYGGCPLKKGDKVLMAFPAGNRDPEHFDRPDEFIIDRQRNRHFAFGAGDRKSTRLNSSHVKISYAVFCLKKKNSYL